MISLKGWRYRLFITGGIGFIVACLYPIAIAPIINPGYYQRIQKVTRANVNQAEVQPGNMKVWSNPFDTAKGKDTNSTD